MDTGLKDRVALVTGSSSGIGRATAIAFAREGARVAITYHTNRKGGEETAKMVKAMGGEASVSAYDLGDPASIEAAVEGVVRSWGAVHILVNNALPRSGVEQRLVPPMFENEPLEKWQSMIRGSLEGVFITVQSVLPGMRAQGWGRIVNISSNHALRGTPGGGAYVTAKAGLHGLTRALAVELGPAGILTNAVLPGLVIGESADRRLSPEAQQAIEQGTPSRHISTPEDVAALVVFLCSAANGNVNGEIIQVTGGR